MATNTYTPIASITLGSSASSVTFSSIPQDYRDLVLVVNGSNTSDITMQFNSDSGSNYTNNAMIGRAAGVTASAFSGSEVKGWTQLDPGVITSQIMDYSATDKHKTLLTRSNDASSREQAVAMVSRWANTDAIFSIKVSDDGSPTQIAAGSTLALYGIEA